MKIQVRVIPNLIDAATLMGTNCFIVGTGKERFMIDAADFPERNAKFLEALQQLMRDQNISISVSNSL